MEYVELEQPELPYEINEEMKLLRTNIQFCGADKRVICITSAIASEGKSTTVLNLCRSFADQKKRVLLIDADLRKSVLRKKITSGKIQYGLSHYLSGQCKAEDATCQTNIKGMAVIFSLVVPPNPSELLSNRRMVELIKAARESFDYVIIDCPPLGLVVDAAVVAQYCDGVCVVISANEISYRAAQDVLHKLENTKCPILGVILNKVDPRRGGKYYGGYYGRYGKYYGKYYGKKYERYY